jgi:hypothetical protein
VDGLVGLGGDTGGGGVEGLVGLGVAWGVTESITVFDEVELEKLPSLSVKLAVTVKLPIPKAHPDEQPVRSPMVPFKPTWQTLSPFALNVTSPIAA